MPNTRELNLGRQIDGQVAPLWQLNWYTISKLMLPLICCKLLLDLNLII